MECQRCRHIAHLIDVSPRCLREAAPRIGRERLQIATRSFCIEDAKRKRALARTRDAGNTDNLMERHTHIDRLQVVHPGAFDLYRFRDVLHACLQDSKDSSRVVRMPCARQVRYSSQARISAVWG